MGLTYWYVGFYRGTDSRVADQRVQEWATNKGRLEGYEMTSPPGPLPSAVIATLPTSVYRGAPSVNRSADKVAMLDSTPISRPYSGPRSPRFHEHLPEMEDTSPLRSRSSPTINRITTPTEDSPTLGRIVTDDVRQRRHLLLWNNYDPSHASTDRNHMHEMEATIVPKTPRATARSPQQVSPDTEPGPSDGRFMVSPFGSLERAAR